MTRCVMCGADAVRPRRIRRKSRGGALLAVTVERCTHCGETYYDIPTLRALGYDR
ncbi:MAG: YgiT-type zinc finger protein [Phycisphaerales bacterium]|nr:YgiT-type zinc finger protein [Phycisphaerales bacterium]